MVSMRRMATIATAKDNMVNAYKREREDRFDKTESAMIKQDEVKNVRFLAMKMNRKRRTMANSLST